MRLSDLRKGTKTIPVTFGGETLNVTFSGHKVTPDFLDKMADANSRPVYIVANLVTAWDLADDDGLPVALDEKTLGTLPLPFLDEVGAAMLANLNPKARGAS